VPVITAAAPMTALRTRKVRRSTFEGPALSVDTSAGTVSSFSGEGDFMVLSFLFVVRVACRFSKKLGAATR
jgi:hypothetical protein